MSSTRSRTQEQIFNEMFRQLRAHNPDVPESPERLDPILKTLLELFAYQLETIDRRLDRTWEVSTASLIRAVCPERGRWPVPAHTVMRCQPVDPVVEVDTHTRFFYRERREGGQTFFFSPERDSSLLAAQVTRILLRHGHDVFDLSPRDESVETIGRPSVPATLEGRWQLCVAVEYSGPPSALTGAVAFVQADPEALKQLKWAHWFPGSHDGSYHEDCGFCPGLSNSVEQALGAVNDGTDSGGLRTGADLFTDLADNFVVLPSHFTATWEPGPMEPELAEQCRRHSISVPAAGEHHHWIRMDMSPRGDRTAFEKPVSVFFDCLIATNKAELTLFKHTGGNRLVEVEIPEDLSAVLEVVSVVDSNAREYRDIDDLQAEEELGVYVLEERNDHLVVWFDFSSSLNAPPDSITVTYAVTAGVRANGIDAGKIVDLYESHPGIAGVENVTPTTGAVPARTEAEILREVSSRLRQRDRALTFPDIANWSRTFDPRIQEVVCDNGIERAERGVRRCIVVTITVSREAFYSDEEISLLQTRLQSFLKSRAPVNTQFRVEVKAV